MLKHVLMASAVMISVPALAQETPVQDTTAPTEQIAPETTEAPMQEGARTPIDPAQDMTQQAETMPTQPMPTEPVPAEPAQSAETTPTEPVPTEPVESAETTPAPMDEGQEAPAQSADAAPAGEPVAGADQVAQVVEAEFPTYDKDADGELKSEEFGQWMVALRSASDPSTDAQSAEVKTWVDGAFASADADKSDTVSKIELTGFLSQGAS